jgi:pimeloyl-ACP methyl ester carboxylesterase
MISYKQAIVDGTKIFYREAGPTTASTMLLLHGFPTSSHMFRRTEASVQNAPPPTRQYPLRRLALIGTCPSS